MNDKIPWLQKNAHNLLPVLLCVTDYVAVVAAECLSYGLRKYWLPISEPTFSIPEIYLFVIVPTIFLCFLHIAKTHILNVPAWRLMQNVFYACSYAVVLICMLMYFAKVGEVVSRLFVALTWFLSFVFILLLRYNLKKFLYRVNFFRTPVLFVGAGITAELVIDAFARNQGFGYSVIGFIDDHPVSDRLAAEYSVLGGFADIESVIRQTGVPYVIITAPGLNPLDQVDLVNRIQPLVKSVAFVPDFMGAPVNTMDVETLFDERIIFLKVRNNLAQKQNRLLKRLFDIVCCLAGLTIVLPLCVVIGVLIKLDSPGSVFYTHRRIGQNGREFSCCKFRSMYSNSEEILQNYLSLNDEAKKEWEKFAKLKDDPRVTRIGAFLRHYSLDELPQVFNVIKGDMSLVGPRPYLPREKESMGKYRDIITVTVPGITGLWQTSGRNELSFKERLRMDAWYVRNWSVWMDVIFLLKTFSVVVRGKGAY